MPEIDFWEIVEALCKRPKMYTATGSFNEVIAFLMGYGLGANVGEKSYHNVFSPFLNWLADKFDLQEPISGWHKFRTLFPTDEEALKNLPILYKEYAKITASQD